MADEIRMTQEATYTEPLDDEYEASQSARGWARLIPYNNNGPVKELKNESIVIGRRSTCDVQVNHITVSGRHCRIYRKDNKVVFIADTSTNGTTVNGKTLRREEILLEDGSEIVLVPARDGHPKISYTIHLVGTIARPREGPEVRYDIRQVLGSGAFAQVKLCVSRTSGERFAIKVIDKKQFKLRSTTSRPNALMDEVNILKCLNHPNIIRIYDMYENDKELSLVLELVEGGDLFTAIVDNFDQNGRGFDESRAKHIFKQLVAGVEYMHENKIAHRDLKPENILLKDKKSDTVKITDFGLSRIVAEGSFLKTLCGTPMYLAPEVLPTSPYRGRYSVQCDLWSLGAVLYVMLSGCAPFDESNPNVPIVEQISKGMYEFPDTEFRHVSADAKDLIRRLLTVDPQERYKMQEVKQHPWMRPPRLTMSNTAAAPKVSRRRPRPRDLDDAEAKAGEPTKRGKRSTSA